MSDYDDVPYIVIERRGAGVGTFLWGAMIGAAAALLLAPRSGEQTRDEIRTGVRRLRRRAENAVRDVQDTVLETLETVKADVGDRLDAARGAFEAGRDAARETRAELDRRVAEARAGFRAGVDAARAHEPTRPDDGAERDGTAYES